MSTEHVRTRARAARSAWRFSSLALACLLGVSPANPSGPRRADSLLAVGTPAPEVSLPTLEGGTVRLSESRGKVVLLLFGELYNKNTVSAAKSISAVLERPAYADLGATAYLIITQKAPPGELLEEARRAGVTFPVLHDRKRQAFASYRVQVLPSLLVVGRDGLTVLPCAGYPLDFEDTVNDVLLYAAGSLSEEEYHRRQDAGRPAAIPKEQIRAVRLASLGEQLRRRGYVELAMSTFRDAIAEYSDCVPAHIGLGNCFLGRRELAEAEKHFLHVVGSDPASLGASLGLIQIQTFRGGEELQLASARVKELLGTRPNDPQVLYVAGVVAEKVGDMEGALGYYKRAAELALHGRQRDW